MGQLILFTVPVPLSTEPNYFFCLSAADHCTSLLTGLFLSFCTFGKLPLGNLSPGNTIFIVKTMLCFHLCILVKGDATKYMNINFVLALGTNLIYNFKP